MNLIELIVQILEEEGFVKADTFYPGTYHFGVPDRGYRDAVSVTDRQSNNIHISRLYEDSKPINAVVLHSIRFRKNGKRSWIINFNEPNSIEEFKEAIG